MSNKQLVGIIGIVLLIIGLFIPFVKAPPMGGISFFESNKTESIIVIGLSAISLILIFAKRYLLLWFSSIATLLVVSTTAIQTVHRLMSARSTAEKIIGEKLTNKLASKLTNIAIEHVYIYWGLAFLILGLILIVLCPAISRTKKVMSDQ
jgi:phosphoglycerol transferase MdoB-like AlkP superfamily enzyme